MPGHAARWIAATFAAVAVTSCKQGPAAPASAKTGAPPPAFDPERLYQRVAPAVFRVETDTALGTAFAIGDGTILVTNYHVIKGANRIKVIGDGAASVLEVGGFDIKRDIALLKLSKAMTSRPLTLNEDPAPKVGSQILVVSNPHGLDKTLSVGLITGVRDLDGHDLIQHSAPISHGSSGGPMVDASGAVVGVVCMYLGDAQQVNFAVNATQVRPLVRNPNWIPTQTFCLLHPTSSADPAVAESNDSGTGSEGKRVLGKLGQALRDVGIHAGMSDGSHVYYQTKQYEYLVVNATRSAGWASVVLQNGSKGYIPSDAVAVLPYDVLQSAPKHTAKPQDLDTRREPSKRTATSTPGDVAGLATEYIGTPYAVGRHRSSGWRGCWRIRPCDVRRH